MSSPAAVKPVSQFTASLLESHGRTRSAGSRWHFAEPVGEEV